MTQTRSSYYQLATRRHAPVLGEAWESEHNIIAAILEQAMWDATATPNSVPLTERMDAQRWFLSKSNALGSFRWVCRELGQDWRAVLGAIRPKFAPAITQRQYIKLAGGVATLPPNRVVEVASPPP